MLVTLRAIRPKKFKVLDPGVTAVQAKLAIREYLDEVKRQLQENYDTAEPGPTYVRRYKGGNSGRGIGGGWRVHVPSNNFGELVNNVRGVQFVQGRYRTGRHRSAGWLTINQIAHDTRPRFAQIVNRRITPPRFLFDIEEE